MSITNHKGGIEKEQNKICGIVIKRQGLPQTSYKILEKLPYVSEPQLLHL